MKVKRWKILLLLGLIILFIPQVRANPVPLGRLEPMILFGYLNLLFVVTIIIEINVIKYFLRSNHAFGRKDLNKSITLVNLLTFPATQIIAFIVFQTYFGHLDIASILFISILIELFPISLECLLYLKIFDRLNRRPYFKHLVDNKTIVKSTITANFISFSVGVGIYLLFVMYMNYVSGGFL
jgi:hypothetical protein